MSKSQERTSSGVVDVRDIADQFSLLEPGCQIFRYDFSTLLLTIIDQTHVTTFREDFLRKSHVYFLSPVVHFGSPPIN